MATVLAGPKEFDLLEDLNDVGDVNIEANTIRIDITTGIGFASQPFNGWVLSDLNWVGADGIIIGRTVIDSLGAIPAISFEEHLVRFNYTGIAMAPSDFVLVELQVSHIPEPSTLAPFTVGLAGFGMMGLRRKVTAD